MRLENEVQALVVLCPRVSVQRRPRVTFRRELSLSARRNLRLAR